MLDSLNPPAPPQHHADQGCAGFDIDALIAGQSKPSSTLAAPATQRQGLDVLR